MISSCCIALPSSGLPTGYEAFCPAIDIGSLIEELQKLIISIEFKPIQANEESATEKAGGACDEG